MKVSDVMTRDVRSTEPKATLQQAAAMLAELNVGSLPVCEGGKLLGIVTDRDIAIRGVAKGLAADRATVDQVMSRDPHTVKAADTVADAIRSMGDQQVRRLPVVDAEGRLAGIVSLGDMAVRQDDGTKVEAALTKISQ